MLYICKLAWELISTINLLLVETENRKRKCGIRWQLQLLITVKYQSIIYTKKIALNVILVTIQTVTYLN